MKQSPALDELTEILYLRSLVEQSSEGLVVIRPGLVIAFVNSPVERFLGLSFAEIVGRNFEEFITEEDQEKERAIFLELLSRPGLIRRSELRFRREDGSYRDVALTLRSHHDPKKNEVYLTLNAVDVSFRREVEKSLASLGERFLGRGSGSQGNIDIIVTEGRILENADMMVYTRGRPNERQSFGSSSVNSDDLRPFAGSELFLQYPVDCTKGPIALNDLAESADSSPLFAEASSFGISSLTAFPVINYGEVAGTLYALYRNTTHLGSSWFQLLDRPSRAIVAEERRLAYEQNLKDFIAIASHELRHPMAIIKGYANTIQQHLTELSDEERDSILESISRSVDRLTRLVAELLDVSDIEQGKFDLAVGVTNVGELIERAVLQLRERGIDREFIVDIQEEIAPIPVGSVNMLLGLVHILENAVNFSEPPTPIEVIGRADDEGVKIQVLDRGRGIPEDDRNLVFNRFFRVTDVGHHSVPGVGLGLYITKNIVESRGGFISCEAREGGGTEILVRFPWSVVPGGSGAIAPGGKTW